MQPDTRDPLVPDPEEPPPPSEKPVARDVLSVIRDGLEPRGARHKRVIVIGAGMAGLVAAYELKRQGRVYFAGEHCSLYHAWIQGALESGIKAGQEIHANP